MQTMKDLGELGFIERIRNAFPHNGSAVLGIGDDCAAIPIDQQRSMLVSTDILTEGIHFTAEISGFDLGYKSLAVNLSDIAAKGGRPTYCFLSVCLPSHTQLSFVDEFIHGFSSLAKLHGVALLGGDTSGSLGPITVSVTIMGEILHKNLKLRSAALAGDQICVSGPLGDSLLGLQLIQANSELSKKLSKLNFKIPQNLKQVLRQRHWRPTPQIQEGIFLSSLDSVHAMMDLSDGLKTDLARMCKASACGAAIHLENIPLSSEAREFCGFLDWDPAEAGVVGGEDYQLLLTVAPNALQETQKLFKGQFGRELYCLGTIIEANQGITYLRAGKKTDIQLDGFQHF